jgi:hypothetical protein
MPVENPMPEAGVGGCGQASCACERRSNNGFGRAVTPTEPEIRAGSGDCEGVRTGCGISRSARVTRLRLGIRSAVLSSVA